MARMPVETGKIREYARATQNSASQYLAEERAPITPTFLSSVVFWENLTECITSPDATDACRALGIEPDARSLLSLEQEYVFHGEIPRAGDVLDTRTRFDGVEVKERSRGSMLLMHFAVEFLGERGELRAECLYTSAYLSETGGES